MKLQKFNRGQGRLRTTLSFEQLERRDLMTANYLLLDFTPDAHQGSMADTFYSVVDAGRERDVDLLLLSTTALDEIFGQTALEELLVNNV